MERPLNALYRFLPGISLPSLSLRFSFLSFSLPFAYSPFPRLLFLSPPSSAPVTGGVSLRQLLAVFAERSLPLASFSLGYTEFHARCRLPSLARQIAREQTPASGVLVTTYEQPETGVKRLRELDDI